MEMRFDLSGKRIWVAGHTGMVGSALVRRLQNEPVSELLLTTRNELDLTNQASVSSWMKMERPDAVIIAAAKVGGIIANQTYPAEFLYENVMIASNIINASHINNVEKLLFLGSSCVYPKFSKQPIDEGELLSGSLEETNQWYAIAKISGIKMCEAYRAQYGKDFISAMPTNLYGPGDNFHPSNSHVVPALIRKAHEAKMSGADEMMVWGTGSVLREFMHADDCADGLVYILKNYSEFEHINVGYGSEITISELAKTVCEVVGFSGQLKFDTSKPDGTPRKLMSNEKLASMGWKPSIGLSKGLRNTYEWFLTNKDIVRNV